MKEKFILDFVLNRANSFSHQIDGKREAREAINAWKLLNDYIKGKKVIKIESFNNDNMDFITFYYKDNTFDTINYDSNITLLDGTIKEASNIVIDDCITVDSQ